MYNGLLPDGTKPLPESMFTYNQLGFVAFPLDHLASDISDQLLENDLCDIYFKFPRVNELNLGPLLLTWFNFHPCMDK